MHEGNQILYGIICCQYLFIEPDEYTLLNCFLNTKVMEVELYDVKSVKLLLIKVALNVNH